MSSLNFNLNDLKLSGKGIKLSETDQWTQDNFKMVPMDSNFYEVIIESPEIRRMGWVVLNSVHIYSDFTIHTEKGMEGKSMNDIVEYPFIFDNTGLLKEILPDELVEMDISEAQIILDKYKIKSKHNLDLYNDNEVGKLVIISTKSEYIFVQSTEESVRIHDEEVYVLNKKKEGHDKLTVISSKDGILHVGGRKNIRIDGHGPRISIDDIDYTPDKIVKNITSKVKEALDSLKFTMD